MRSLQLPGRHGSVAAGTRPEDRSGPSVPLVTLRVALAATAIVAAAYLAIAIAVAGVVSANLMAEVDGHLAESLDFGARLGEPGLGLQPGGGGGRFDPSRQDPRAVPVLLWHVSAAGTPSGVGLTELSLPAGAENVTAPTTVAIDGDEYRIAGRDTASGGRVIVGQSLEAMRQTQSTLIVAEVVTGCALLVFVLLGSLAIGWRVALPIERARRRQLEFTADASHELRTPLSVVEAQTSLALARRREAGWDAAAFSRIDAELRRMRRLLDDMLWLARFDSSARAPASEPVDLGVLAAQTADRFAAVAEARGQKLTLAVAGNQPCVVAAPPEWLDRLVGVLLDNACKYSPEGGAIQVSVGAEGRRVRLTVDDSGPGIPEAERARVFDRFHRATDAPGGAGLGLAIARAIAGGTGGRWSLGESPLGGARLSVSWPRTLHD